MTRQTVSTIGRYLFYAGAGVAAIDFAGAITQLAFMLSGVFKFGAPSPMFFIALAVAAWLLVVGGIIWMIWSA